MTEPHIGMLCTQTTKGMCMANTNILIFPNGDLNDFSVLVSNKAIGLSMGGFRNSDHIISVIA